MIDIDKVNKLTQEIIGLTDEERDYLFKYIMDDKKIKELRAESMKVNKEFEEIEEDVKDDL